MSRHRKTSVQRAQDLKITRSRALALTGVLAFTGAAVAAGVGVHTSSAQAKTRLAADAVQVTALKAAQSQADGTTAKNNIDPAALKLVDSRSDLIANRSAQRADIATTATTADTAAATKAAADKAVADKAISDKAIADKAAADKAAADKAAVAKASADKAAAAQAAADKAAADKAASDAAAKAAAARAATPAYANNLDGWIKEAQAILSANGYSVSYNAIYQTAIHESGGNPSAGNNWDSNAAAGTPSIGLMQVIQPTFNAYALSGHGDIYNPVDNIIAGARYAAATYGSLDNVVAARGGGSNWYGY